MPPWFSLKWTPLGPESSNHAPFWRVWLTFSAEARGSFGERCLESHGIHLRLTCPPSDPPDPEERWSSFAEWTASPKCPSVPRSMGCWPRARARKSSCVICMANLVLIHGSSQLWSIHFSTWAGSHPLSLLSSLPPDLSPCNRLMGWPR